MVRLLRALTSSLVLLAGWFVSPLGGQETAMVFGSAGELIQVRAGAYGDLFPNGGHGVAADTPVLSLETTRAGGESERLLVPGSEGVEGDGRASLVFDSPSGSLFLLWESKLDSTLSRLNLVRFAEGQFSELIEVSGDPLALKRAPQLVLTRADYGASDRSVVHLLWWEEAEESDAFFYTPIVLTDGEYLGWNPVIPLNQFDSRPVGRGLPAGSLYEAPVIDTGRDARSVVVGFAHRETERFLALEIQVLPSALSQLADDAWQQILDAGLEAGSGPTTSLAQQVRAHIIGAGFELHPGVLAYLGEEAYAEILRQASSFSPANLQLIADQARAHIIGAGAGFDGSEFDPGPDPAECSLLHMGATPDGDTARSLHQLEICLVSSRPLPSIGGGPAGAFVSEDAEEVLVWWEEEELRYRQSAGEGWTEVRTANRDETVDLERAKEILRQLVRTH